MAPKSSRTNRDGNNYEQEEHADAGASEVQLAICNNLKIGDYVVIRGRPCKIVEKTTSKTGKHGSCKAHITALDIFTHKKLECLVNSTANCEVPVITKADYQLIDVQEEDYLSLMNSVGETRADLKLPSELILRERIQSLYDEGKSVLLSVIKAMGEEGIVSAKEIQDTF
eukprot:TRINITY_DN2933_c0_g1_i1.p1 TRINITY_DN2933_c0_g1~~TRINITY_DN2933_c0_g1_i1.p1  ORF type:complete len:170 (-),score=26.65 TRINITY_DN2933_c0_g1_i1:163-672(-)